jgi:hypothetical protein
MFRPAKFEQKDEDSVATVDEPAPEQKDEDSVATVDELIQSVQTAAGFAESVVKRLWSYALNKDMSELFDDDNDAHVGSIALDAKEGSGQTSYSIKLDIVNHDDRVDMLQFKNIPYIFDEMSRILAAAELYWSYSKKIYKLPELNLWRSNWGTLFVAGSPQTMKQIGIRIIRR